MRWMTNFEKKRRLYESGNKTRTITKFLWIPKCIKGEYRWLETSSFTQHLEYESSGCDMCDCWDASYTWINDSWVDNKEEMIIYHT